MSDIEFGDDAGPDDAFSAEGDPAPEQVTYRIFELRHPDREFSGETDQTAWLQLGEVIVARLRERDNGGARRELVTFLRDHEDDGFLEARRRARDIISHVVDWLRREGTLRDE